MFSTLPNTLSLLRILLSPVFFLLFISGDPILRQISVAVFFIAALTDWYDGALARSRDAITVLGKFLDPLADKFLTSAAFIAFAFSGYVAWWMVIVISTRDILITLLRSFAERKNAHVVTSRTAQTKTFIQMTVLYYVLLVVVGQDILWVTNIVGPLYNSLLDTVVLEVLMVLVTVITVFTGIQYFYDNRSFILGFIRKADQIAG